jgi:hypothetical protein
MTTVVQLTGCFETDEREVVPFVSNEDADFYGVYIGEPGDFHWQADFLHYEDAMIYVKAISKHHGIPIDDKTFYEGNSNDTHH